MLILKLSPKRLILVLHAPQEKSFTQAYQKHEASGFGYKVVCHYNQKYSKPAVIYRGENVIEKFIQNLFEEVKDCQKVISEKAKKDC